MTLALFIGRAPEFRFALTTGELDIRGEVKTHKTIQLRRKGFTLIEAAIVTVIVGVGAISLLQLLAAGSMANADSTELTTAVFLAENINEMLTGATYGTLHNTYDNVTYSTPKDGRGTDLSGFSGWQQKIDVSYVDPDSITTAVADTPTR
jgi:prepilin-type N-terminal cleavage/methylation domain-containing protein